MKLLNKNSDYAIRSLIVLAFYGGQFISVHQISKKEGIPYHYLRRILQALIRKRLVISKEGYNGGFQLAVSPDRIKLLDVIQLFQGEFQLSDCTFREKLCAKRHSCILRSEIKRVEKTLKRQFEAISLKGLVQSHEKKNCKNRRI